MALRFREVSDLILYELYWFSADPAAPDDIEPESLHMIMEERTSNRFVEAAVEKLGAEGYIERAGVLPDSVAITEKGLSYVDESLDDPNTFLWEEHQRRPPDDRASIPAAGRYVELDHNSQAYKDTINAGQKLMEAVRTSNTYADTDELDKERRVAELEAGYRLLKASRVSPTTVKGVLGGVLAYLATKFADEPIADLAKVAWGALKELLGLL